VEFQTGHALWALHAAQIPVTNPQIAKAIDYLMRRQQEFGGWMDPLQSFENFRTPFRETQMVVLALSSYFPGSTSTAGRAKGWNSAKLEKLSNDPVEMLEQLDNVWDSPSPQVRVQIQMATASPDALIRQAAVEALGRLGESPLQMGDPSKMVQRTAAWAMRQAYSRHADKPASDLLSAATSGDDRRRWAGTRVFAYHFSELAKQPAYAEALAKQADDPVVTVRMNAIKGLWQFWFWTPDVATKSMIEDTLLAARQTTKTEWVTENLSRDYEILPTRISVI
jgi:HEAT repeat protein